MSHGVLLTEISMEKAKHIRSTFVPGAVSFTPLTITVEKGAVSFGDWLIPNRSNSVFYVPDFFFFLIGTFLRYHLF